MVDVGRLNLESARLKVKFATFNVESGRLNVDDATFMVDVDGLKLDVGIIPLFTYQDV